MRFAAPLLGAVVAGVLAACLPAAAQAQDGHRVAFGAFHPDAPDERSAADSFNRLVGRKAAFWHQYKNWDQDPFARRTVQGAWDAGGVPLITWEPHGRSPGRIARGDYDNYLRDAARSGAEFGKPVLLRPLHEMNGNWYSWGLGVNGNSAGDLIRAWKHIVQIFREERASNVLMVWSPNVGGSIDSLYPGDEWVDYVGLDGYNWGAYYNSWQSFEGVFGNSYRVLARISSKPIMIPEFASNEAGGDKPAWIRDAFSSKLASRYPRIRAVGWFNINKETDWRVNSSPETLSVFRSVIADSMFDLDAAGLLRLAKDAPAPPPSDPSPADPAPAAEPASPGAGGKLHCRVRAGRSLPSVRGRWEVLVGLSCDRAADHRCSGLVRVREARSRRVIGTAEVELWPGRGRPVRVGLPGWEHTSLSGRRRVAVRIGMQTDSGCTAGAVRRATLRKR